MAAVSSPSFTIHEDDDPFAGPDGSSSPNRPEATEDEYEADDSVLTSDGILQSADPGVENMPALPSSPPAGKVLVKVTPRYLSSATKSSRQSEVSSLPESIAYDERDMSPYVPMKHRPVYRDGSTRIRQMASPPDSYSPSRSSSRLSERVYRMPKPERRLLSPQSQTSRSNGTARSSRHGTPSALQTPTNEEHPLVLLHVTILPQPWPYSTKSMEAVLPEHIIESQRALEEKLNPTILARGLLLSHPGEEYDLLEERILESLELRTPRILKCGHYHREELGTDSSSSLEDNVTIGRGHDTFDCHVARDSSDNMVFDPDTHCNTCHRTVGLPGTGTGEGDRKFDLKVYAANGLMRAGAWSAAWKEMEKVDVEIGTWVPDHLRRDLDDLLEQEEQEAITEAQAAEEERLRAAAEQSEQAEQAERLHEHQKDVEGLSRGRAAGVLTPPPDEAFEAAPYKPQKVPHADAAAQVPLATLLQNYILVLAQDRRNLAILLLSLLVLLVSMRSGAPGAVPAAPVGKESFSTALPEPQVVGHAAAPSPLTVVSISTALSVSTVTVVETATQSMPSVMIEPAVEALSALSSDEPKPTVISQPREDVQSSSAPSHSLEMDEVAVPLHTESP